MNTPAQNDLPTGLVRDMDPDKYHEDPGISASCLGALAKSGAHYYAHRTEPREETPAKRYGKMLHTAILEPDQFDKRYCVLPKDAPRKPSSVQIGAKNPSQATLDSIKWWDDWNEANVGMVIVPHEEMEEVKRISGSVLRHPVMRALDGATKKVIEGSFFGVDAETGVRIRARPDILAVIDSSLIYLDPKSTEDVRPAAFQKSVYNYGYYRQLPFYERAIIAAGFRKPDNSMLIAFEKTAPFATRVYELEDDARSAGEYEVNRLLELYAELEGKYGPPSADWPGYPTAVERISLPAWAT